MAVFMINSVNLISATKSNYDYQKNCAIRHSNVTFKANEPIQQEPEKSFLTSLANFFIDITNESKIASAKGKLKVYSEQVYADYFNQMRDIRKTGENLSTQACFKDIYPDMDSKVTMPGIPDKNVKIFYELHYLGQDFSRYMKFDEEGKKYFDAKINQQENPLNNVTEQFESAADIIEFTTPNKHILINKLDHSITEETFSDGKLQDETRVYLDSGDKFYFKYESDNKQVVQKTSKIRFITEKGQIKILEVDIKEH